LGFGDLEIEDLEIGRFGDWEIGRFGDWGFVNWDF
jgi:hypothetical protein